MAISCSVAEQCTGKVGNGSKLGHNVGGPQILMGGHPQIVHPISKITPKLISDLLSNKGCLSVERPRTLGGERKKRNKLLLKNRKCDAFLMAGGRCSLPCTARWFG